VGKQLLQLAPANNLLNVINGLHLHTSQTGHTKLGQISSNILLYYYTCTSSVMILNRRRWQSLGGQHGKGVDGLFEKVNFQTAFEGVENG